MKQKENIFTGTVGVDRLSNNSLSKFQKCPYSFDLAYNQKVRYLYENHKLFLGKRIHETLDFYYENLPKSTPAGAVEFFLMNFDVEVEKAGGILKYASVPESGKKTSNGVYCAEDMRNLGIKLLDSYFKTYAGKPELDDFDAFIDLEDSGATPDDFEVLATEREFEFELALDKGTIKISGIIDMIIKDKDGNVWGVDHKTRGQKYPEGYLDQDTQASIYMLGMQALGYKPVGFIYSVILKYVRPICTRYYVKRSESQLVAFRANLGETIKAIRAGVKYKCISEQGCAMCDFKKYCWNGDESDYSFGEVKKTISVEMEDEEY
jgi:CRISPR/Cas system-associated exonuclease Cas4 (RecB family)